MKFRLLPAAILVATTLLGVKLVGLWSGIDALVAGPAVAQSAAPQPPAQPPPETAAETRPAPASAAATAPLPEDPTLMSQAEIDLLQRLAERRHEIEGWRKDLELRESLLKAAEERLDAKLGELKTVQFSVRAMLKQHGTEQAARLKSLVKIYEAMKPKEAAVIFEKLDMAILLDVIEGMKEARIAPVIAAMDPAKAREVTAELAKRRKIAAESAQNAERAAAP